MYLNEHIPISILIRCVYKYYEFSCATVIRRFSMSQRWPAQTFWWQVHVFVLSIDCPSFLISIVPTMRPSVAPVNHSSVSVLTLDSLASIHIISGGPSQEPSTCSTQSFPLSPPIFIPFQFSSLS